MRYFYLLIILLSMHCNSAYDPTLSPLENAEQQYAESLSAELQAVGYPDKNKVGRILLRAFKEEKKLEVWIEKPGADSMLLFKVYDFAGFSGTLGPKRKEGDFQIPEGVYFIDRFNPRSRFHLSLGLNYPNKSDRILGHPTAPGSDIFIHGNTQTIGCIPITDLKIRELYLLTSYAAAGRQKQIPVFIFPFVMNDKNMSRHSDSKHFGFWKNLAVVFDKSNPRTGFPPEFSVNEAGEYF